MLARLVSHKKDRRTSYKIHNRGWMFILNLQQIKPIGRCGRGETGLPIVTEVTRLGVVSPTITVGYCNPWGFPLVAASRLVKVSLPFSPHSFFRFLSHPYELPSLHCGRPLRKLLSIGIFVKKQPSISSNLHPASDKRPKGPG